ncbi:MAG: cell division protein FtsL, partial [Acidimicrobiales bacterium]
RGRHGGRPMNMPLTAPRHAPKQAPKETPRHLKVVGREPDPGRLHRSRRLFVGAGAALVVAVAFALVYLHVVMAQKQIELDRLNAQVAQRAHTYQQLRLEVARLSSPQQIISTAEGRLGMRQPASVTYLQPPAGTRPAASAASTLGSSSATAPAGLSNWPQIKSELAGRP